MFKRKLWLVGLAALLLVQSVGAATPPALTSSAPATYQHVVFSNTDGACTFSITTNSQAVLTYKGLGCAGTPLSSVPINTPTNTTLLTANYTYAVTNVRDTVYYVADTGLIYKVPVTGGTPSVVAEPYNSTPRPASNSAVHMPCRPSTALSSPSGASAPIYALKISPDQRQLLYTTLRAEHDEYCGTIDYSFDIHRVALDTNTDTIINGALETARTFFVTTSGAAIFRDYNNPASFYLATIDGSVTPITTTGQISDSAIHPLYTHDQVLLITNAGGSYGIARLDVASKTSTPIFSAGSAPPSIVAISADEQLLLVRSNSSFVLVDIATGAQTPLSIPTSAAMVYMDQSKVIYQDGLNLYVYMIASQQSTLLFEDTNPDRDYFYLSNHAGTNVLLSAYYESWPAVKCITTFEALNVDTAARETLYELDPSSNSSMCVPYDETQPVAFSPNDQLIVFRQLDSAGYSIHGLYKHQTFQTVATSYIPLLLN